MNFLKSELVKKALKFFLTSGIGFIMDFCAYTFMAQKLGFAVQKANFISSLIGVTFVFIVSTRKIFDNENSRLPLIAKYLIYVAYQLVLIFVVSQVGGVLNSFILGHISIEIVTKYSKLISKVLITPFTMIINFIAMRFLTEKL